MENNNLETLDIEKLDRNGYCPVCKTNWDNGDILEELSKLDLYSSKTHKEMLEIASNYGYSVDKPNRFSKLLIVEIRENNTSYCECPSCKHIWDVSTGKHYNNINQIKNDFK